MLNEERQKMLDEVRVICAERDARIAELRSQLDSLRREYKAKIIPLREEIKRRKRQISAIELHSEPPDAPVRYCKTCGDPLLAANEENAAKLDAMLTPKKNAIYRWTTVKRMRSDFCCWRCKEGKGGHNILCSLQDFPENGDAQQ